MPSVTALHRFQIILGLLVAGVIIIAINHDQAAARPSTKIRVVASFYPLANFAQQIGGDRVMVSPITPSGAEPHDYEPTPSDITTVEQAQLFLYNGAGLDLWADKISPRLTTDGIVTIKASSYVDVRPAEGTRDVQDPHLWLDPIRVERISQVIHDALVQLDPTHRTSYDSGNAELQFQLAKLQTAYQTGLSQCQSRTIVTSHAAFAYLAERYRLHQVYIAGLAPDEEPSAQHLAAVSQEVKRERVGTIFFESLVSAKFAETIARETGITTAVLNPIEGLTADQIKNGETYLSIMYKNLTALRSALHCS